MDGRYALNATVRFGSPPDVTVEPSAVDVGVYRSAPPPGEDGWLFFRDNCWRGELADPEHMRTLAAEALEAPVADVAFAALECDEAYLEALREAIAGDLAAFNADDVDEVLSKYLGSSIQVA